MHNSKQLRLIKAMIDDYGVDQDRITFEQGGRHIKIYLDGVFVTIFPNGNGAGSGRRLMNNIAQLRRALEGRESVNRRNKSQPQLG